MAKRKFFEKKEDDVEKVTEEVQEQPTEKVKEEIIEEKKEEKPKTGKLINCELLNARKEPNKNSEILFIINSKDRIKILEEINDFYKVEVGKKTAYCMKEFIEVK